MASVQTVLRLYYIMMDPAADDLLTASIGRSPRNDPDPPGPHQADFHGLPLDKATVPASMEARARHTHEVAAASSQASAGSMVNSSGRAWYPIYLEYINKGQGVQHGTRYR